MKKILYLLIFIIINLSILDRVNAGTCRPAYDGNWVANYDCSFDGDYKVYGNMKVGSTLSLGSRKLGIDLSNKWITFSSGKITLNSSGKIHNSAASTRYRVNIRHNSSGKTQCPDGMKVFRASNEKFLKISSNTANSNKSWKQIKYVGASGRMSCGTVGERWQHTGSYSLTNGYPYSY